MRHKRDSVSEVRHNDAKLIKLYAEMSALTAPECASVCRCPHSCCSEEHCEETILWAKKRWGVDLNPKRTAGQDTRGRPLPLLGPTGCVADPHLRPICTVHTCEINGIGCKRGDPAWTAKYFKLRDKLERLETSTLLEDL